MVEIISKGKLKSEAEHILQCRSCDTVAKFKQSEGRVIYDQRDGDYFAFKCPVCSNDITKQK